MALKGESDDQRVHVLRGDESHPVRLLSPTSCNSFTSVSLLSVLLCVIPAQALFFPIFKMNDPDALCAQDGGYNPDWFCSGFLCEKYQMCNVRADPPTTVCTNSPDDLYTMTPTEGEEYICGPCEDVPLD